jgi:hypothetical protein
LAGSQQIFSSATGSTLPQRYCRCVELLLVSRPFEAARCFSSLIRSRLRARLRAISRYRTAMVSYAPRSVSCRREPIRGRTNGNLASRACRRGAGIRNTVRPWRARTARRKEACRIDDCSALGWGGWSLRARTGNCSRRSGRCTVERQGVLFSAPFSVRRIRRRLGYSPLCVRPSKRRRTGCEFPIPASFPSPWMTSLNASAEQSAEVSQSQNARR